MRKRAPMRRQADRKQEASSAAISDRAAAFGAVGLAVPRPHPAKAMTDIN